MKAATLGEMDEAKGRIKDAIREMTRDDHLRRRRGGQGAGSAKDKVEKATDWVKDKIRDSH